MKAVKCPECRMVMVFGKYCNNQCCTNYWDIENLPEVQKDHEIVLGIKTILWVVWRIIYYTVRVIWYGLWITGAICGALLGLYLITNAAYVRMMDNDRKRRIMYQIENHPERFNVNSVRSIL